jgi:hypothetical protein
MVSTYLLLLFVNPAAEFEPRFECIVVPKVAISLSLLAGSTGFEQALNIKNKGARMVVNQVIFKNLVYLEP